jgi:2,3-dihydroxyethylbenzene 1,2-dioxygenase
VTAPDPPAPAQVVELGYLGLAVSDADAWRTYAADVLGMEIVDEGEPDRFYLRMDAQHHRIVVHRDGNDDLAYVGWRVAHAADLEGLSRRLDDLGVAYKVASSEEAEERRVLGLIRLESPGGVPTEVFWGPQVDHHRPFHPGRPMYGRFDTAAGLGHVVLNEEDPEGAARFYREGLGLTGGVEYVFRSRRGALTPQFFHTTGPRQHSVAFGVGPMSKRLHHFMIECTSIDDVGLAHDIVRQRDIPITVPLGKHANDQMLSFYMTTPAGFDVEYGWGGRPPGPWAEYSVADMWGRSTPRRPER